MNPPVVHRIGRHIVVLAILLGAAALTLAAGPSAAAESKGGNPVVIISTSLGDITAELDAEKAPKSVANFLAYVDEGFYDNTIFHRVIKGFMIQGGGMTADMKQKPTRAPIPLESKNGLSNVRGSVAMARTSDPNSASSQFFISVKDNAFLDAANSRDGNGYAVFGKVVSGMDVVDKIRAVPTGPGDVPLQPVTIKKATLEN